MNKIQRVLTVISASIILTAAFTGCSSKNNDAADTATKSETSSSGSSSTTEDKSSQVLTAYKKVNIGMTKEQVDSILALEAKAETGKYAIKGTYNYVDENTGYGVSVIYNDKNLAFAKTVIYGSASDIAPLCKKPVTEEQSKKITTDMDYKEVINILGGEGVECNLTAKENDLSIIGPIRRWANKDGSGIQIVFSSDDKVRGVNYFNHG